MDHQSGTQIDSTLVKMLLSSIKDGDLNIIKNNISKYSLDLKLLIDAHTDQNAYFYAALIKEDSDAYQVFKYFKEMGLDPFLKDKFNQTCLYYTCREGKLQCTKFLVENCMVNVNEKDAYGQNPIYYAVREGRLELVKFLIEKGSDINVEDKFGQNCIFYSVRQGHIDVTQLLIDSGANINKVDKKKMSVYTFAIRNNQMDIANLLLMHGAIKPEPKAEKDKKQKKSKQSSSSQQVQQSEVSPEEIQQLRKFILVKVNEDGQKTPLTEEEYDKFKSEHQDIVKLLEDKGERELLAQSASQDLIYYDSWEKQAKKLMNLIWKFKDSEIFHRPVNPEELGIPDYFTHIKHPMDFSTIKKKLSNFVYTNCKEFCADMDLVFTNCIHYNGERSIVGILCNNVKNEYNKIFTSLGMEKFI